MNHLMSDPSAARKTPWATGAAQWAVRLSQTPYKNFVRELAGLSDQALSALEAETRDSPKLRMPRAWRYGVIGTVLATVAGAALVGVGIESRRSLPADQVELLLLSGAGTLIACLFSTIVCWLIFHRRAPAIRNYKDLIQHVTVLNEQHPWLYETCEIARHADAEAYRRRTLDTRGALRGVDLPMMRLVIGAQSEVLRCRTASEVAQALQTGSTRVVSTAAAVSPPADAVELLVARAEPFLGPEESGTLLHFPHADSGAAPAAAQS